MNTYTGKIGGETYAVTPNSTFPLKYGEFSDKQLDYATLTLTRVNTEHFKPLTPVFITITSVNEVGDDTYTQSKTLSYVLLKDRSQETLVGSGQYRHQLDLIEPTKLLEIPMETLCFTNSGAKEYAQITPPVQAVDF